MFRKRIEGVFGEDLFEFPEILGNLDLSPRMLLGRLRKMLRRGLRRPNKFRFRRHFHIEEAIPLLEH